MIKTDPGKKRIFVIEDDVEMRSLLKDFVEEAVYEVDSTENGSEYSPGLKQIQPGIPIVAITAFGSKGVYSRALERGQHPI